MHPHDSMRSSYWIGGGVALTLAAALALGGESDNSAVMKGLAVDHVHGLAVSHANPDQVFIATHSGLYELTMGGTLVRRGESRDDLMGFTAHPSEDAVMFSSGHGVRGGNLGLRTSADSGLSWQKVSEGLDGPVDFHALAVSGADPRVVYGYYGRLQRSLDGGVTWEYAPAHIEPIMLATDPVDESVVYAATQDGIMVSDTKGDAWKPLSGALTGGVVTVLAINPGERKSMLTFAQRLGGMGRTSDGGETWEKISENFEGGTVLYIAHAPSQPDVVYAVTDARALYRSGDGGSSWTRMQ